MVLYANDGREGVKKPCCPHVAAWIIIAWVETKKEWASELYGLYQFPCLRMPLSRLKDTVLGVRGAILVGLWRWTPPEPDHLEEALLEEFLVTVSAPGYSLWFSLFIYYLQVCTCAKSLHLCLILCNPMECSPPGSTVHGDSPGKNTGVGCHALLQGIFPAQGWNLCLLCAYSVFSLLANDREGN